jgi:hypothetical protein
MSLKLVLPVTFNALVSAVLQWEYLLFYRTYIHIICLYVE